MNNKKGFTLIELLATIAILALIMMLAVPNVMNTIDKNKRNTYVEDAKKMITLAEYQIRSDTSIELPTSGHCIVIKLRFLDLTEFSEGPEGGTYDLDLSYVVISNQDNTYHYAVALQENYGDNQKRGLPLTSRSDLNKEGASQQVEEDELTIDVPVKGQLLDGYYVDNVVGEA